MNFDPDEIEWLHSKIMCGGITYGLDFGSWDEYLNLSMALGVIGAPESKSAIDDFIAFMRPHYDDGGIEAAREVADGYPPEIEEICNRYMDANESIPDLIVRYVEAELAAVIIFPYEFADDGTPATAAPFAVRGQSAIFKPIP